MEKAYFVLASILLAGCGSHTGVVRITDNHYMISKQDIWSYSGGASKADLYKEAAEFCAKQWGKSAQINSPSQDSAWNDASAEVQFSNQQYLPCGKPRGILQSFPVI